MEKQKKVLWVLLFFVSGILYYFLFGMGEITGEVTNSGFIREQVFITRVIDGDTVQLNDSRKVRMLGVNTPEKGKFMSDKAIEFTKRLENETATLEYKEKDKYGRILGYLLFEEENHNFGLLRNGFAHAYYYEKDFYYESAMEMEELARQEKKGIWQDSANFGCLTLIELKYKEDGKRCTNKEQLILRNDCWEIEVLIKDDATHDSIEKISKGTFTKNFSCVFNDAGDSLFIWDDSGLLVFYRYP